ncbi:flippase [Vagococcus fluvialis]|uniref:flippase n=1 Tax=Vagococcus fluvialis TaxID=2738 RepID=UPI003B22619C
MYKKIIAFAKSKTVINGSWLYLLQIFNTIVPLLTLPYITRVLGSSEYGIFSFSLNLISYLQVMVEYGFNLSGARKIAGTEDKNEINKIYNSIMSSKLLLCGISVFLMFLIIVFGSFEKKQLSIMIILFTMVIGASIQQIWLFQGLQKMKYITIVNVITRTISVIMIFLIVNEPNDIYIYSFLFAATTLGNGVFNYLIVKYKLKISFNFVSFKEIKLELVDGWYVFTTDAMSKIFSSFGLTVLGITASNSDVGIYAAIQKIPVMLSMMFAPLSQAIFPVVTKMYKNSFDEGNIFVKKVARIIIPVIGIVVSLICIFSEQIIFLVYGETYSEMHIILIPLILWMFLGIINNFLGIQTLVASGNQKAYSIAFRVGVLSLVVINLLLGFAFGVYGIASAAFFAELILTFSLLFQIKKLKNSN